MRYRGAHLPASWSHGSCCLPGGLSGRAPIGRTYSAAHPQTTPPTQGNSTPPPEDKGGSELMKERALAALQRAGALSRQWGQRSAQTAGASINYWWERYEDFVGITDVRLAQKQVAEAEAAFMVSRGVVRDADGRLEAMRLKLKEVKNRLDRVGREEATFVELVTQEHSLRQEERLLQKACDDASEAEREKFSVFSACVRESHEKERTRAEQTKNWSIIGSVLGALIGVMGSTYINRVRLQELKALLLEAQKGPVSLQEALRVQAGNHHDQQEELRGIIGNFRDVLQEDRPPTSPKEEQRSGEDRTTRGAPLIPPQPSSCHEDALKDLAAGAQRTQTLVEALRPRLDQLEVGVVRLESHLTAVRGLVETVEDRGRLAVAILEQQPGKRSEETQPRLEEEAASTAAPWPVVRPQERSEEERIEARAFEEELLNRLERSQRTMTEQLRQNTLYNAVFSYTAAALTVPALYLLLRGTG